MKVYDIIVIGGGHGGIEASNISSKMGVNTLLITQNISKIGDMPCNPSIGGPAKGVVVREISALGGLMGEIADISFLQTKILNTSKGPGVWAIRNQIDKKSYHLNILKVLKKNANLNIVEDLITSIKSMNKYYLLSTKTNEYKCKVLITTTGTFNSSKLMIGKRKWSSGPNNQATSDGFQSFLKSKNIKTMRFDTGTPPRIDSKTINFDRMKIEKGNNVFWTLGFQKRLSSKNIPCYLTFTNDKTRKIIKENINNSLFFHGNQNSIGPARCPSIETKIMKFEREGHPVFIEPDNSDFSIAYLQGLNTALDEDTQEQLVHSIQGLERAKIRKFGYAIEYVVIDPTQLKRTLEFKNIDNLFSAGQVNGSSGYEEAAAQGIIAGINAAIKIKGGNELVLSKEESYIGMLIDDMTVKGVSEPYRLLTSMMTNRMYVRSDNAHIRLLPYAKVNNLLSTQEINEIDSFLEKEAIVKKVLLKMKPSKNIEVFEYVNRILNSNGKNILNILRDSRVNLEKVISLDTELSSLNLSKQDISIIAINIKYENYISREIRTISKIKKKFSKKIPKSIVYSDVENISNAAKNSLEKNRPSSILEAKDIENVSLADLISLERYIVKK